MARNIITTPPHTFSTTDTWELLGTIAEAKNHHLDALFGDVDMKGSSNLWFMAVIFLDDKDADGPYPFPYKQRQGNHSQIVVDTVKVKEFLKDTA
ncbi:unnamed protein product, partial [marine sediment metagenome]